MIPFALTEAFLAGPVIPRTECG